jgi:hypothetical protein
MSEFIQPPSLPANYCWPATPQQLINDLIKYGLTVAQTASTSGATVVIGSQPPNTTDTATEWIKTDPNTNAYIGTFTFSPQYGIWITPYKPDPTTQEWRIWRGSAAGILTYDGGENAPISDTTGPFWQEDTSMIGPTNSNAASLLAVFGGGYGAGNSQPVGTVGFAPSLFGASSVSTAPYPVYGVILIARTSRIYIRG